MKPRCIRRSWPKLVSGPDSLKLALWKSPNCSNRLVGFFLGSGFECVRRPVSRDWSFQTAATHFGDEEREMDAFSSPGSANSSQFSADDFKDQLKNQLAQAYAEEFLETVRGKCFDKCITKPASSLSGSESSCISRCMERYIEAIGIVSRTLLKAPH